MAIPIETVKTKDFEMRFFRFGSGPRPFIILPGLSVQSVMGAADAVAAAYADFAQDYTVYLFDRREEIPDPYSVYQMGLDTAEAMRALGLRDCDIFGASQGGMIAQVIAIEAPGLVHKLVLGSTSSHIKPEDEPVFREWIRLAEAKDGPALCDAFGKVVYPPAVYEQFRDALLAMGETVTDAEFERFAILTRGIFGFNVSDQLERIQCPVLVMGVYEDAVLESDATMEIAVKLDEKPGFSLFLYTGYGHAAFDTAPDYRERMLRFLRA